MTDASPPRPKHLELKKDQALTIYWRDGRVSVYPVAHLRRMSPSADQRKLRQEMARNPLTVLPSTPAAAPGTAGSAAGGGPLTVTDMQLVGNYAVRLTFSDGHRTGIYSWQYLREIDPTPAAGDKGGGPAGGADRSDGDSDDGRRGR